MHELADVHALCFCCGIIRIWTCTLPLTERTLFCCATLEQIRVKVCAHGVLLCEASVPRISFSSTVTLELLKCWCERSGTKKNPTQNTLDTLFLSLYVIQTMHNCPVCLISSIHVEFITLTHRDISGLEEILLRLYMGAGLPVRVTLSASSTMEKRPKDTPFSPL